MSAVRFRGFWPAVKKRRATAIRTRPAATKARRPRKVFSSKFKHETRRSEKIRKGSAAHSRMSSTSERTSVRASSNILPNKKQTDCLPTRFFTRLAFNSSFIALNKMVDSMILQESSRRHKQKTHLTRRAFLLQLFRSRKKV